MEPSPDTRARRSLVLHPGGLGDLVLLAGLVSALRLSGRHVVLACRSEFSRLPAFYPDPPDEVLPIPFNPFGCLEPEPGLIGALENLLQKLGEPGEFIAAGLHPTWLAWFVAAAIPGSAAVACPPPRPPGGLLPVLLDRFGLKAPLAMSGPEREDTVHERERYRRIAAYLECPAAGPAVWRLPETTRAAAAARLSAWGLEPGRYLACCPLGTSGGELKRWPVESFAAALASVPGASRLPVVVTGATQERETIAEFVSALGEAGQDARVFLGEPDELPALIGLTALAAAYFGNDTGPMHIASAFGVPALAVYGGGAWPSYSPWGWGASGIVKPMPCFGCSWDCIFDRGPCVSGIPVGPVAKALAEMLAYPGDEPRVVTVPLGRDELRSLFPAAVLQFRQSQNDRAERMQSIVELSSGLEDARRSREVFQREAERRGEALDRATREIEAKDRAAAGLLAQLRAAHAESERLSGEASLRLELVSRADAAVRAAQARAEGAHREAERRLELLLQADEAVKTMQVQLQEAQSQAERRLQLLLEADATVRTTQAHLLETHHEAERRLEALRQADEDSAAARAEMDRLHAEAERRLEHLRRSDEAMNALRAELKLREEAIAALTAELGRRDLRAVSLAVTASERLEALNRVNEEAARIRQIVSAQQKEIDSLRARIAVVSGLSVPTD